MSSGCTRDGQPFRDQKRQTASSFGKSPLDRRWALAWYGDLHTRSGMLAGMVEDVSADGAKVRVGRDPIDGRTLPSSYPIPVR
jgi:hypothetical protein